MPLPDVRAIRCQQLASAWQIPPMRSVPAGSTRED